MVSLMTRGLKAASGAGGREGETEGEMGGREGERHFLVSFKKIGTSQTYIKARAACQDGEEGRAQGWGQGRGEGKNSSVKGFQFFLRRGLGRKES